MRSIRIGPWCDRGRGGRLPAALVQLALATVLGWLAGAPPAAGYYEDADVRAILFSREWADTIAAPLVVLAHQTEVEMIGNGARAIQEHWLWLIGDPDHPACRRLQQPAILLDRTTEGFGLRRCRIYRGDDTLRVESGWELRDPGDWPEHSSDPFQEISTAMPPLQRGDVVELAYLINNHWSPNLFPSDWQQVPLTSPEAPTIERHVILTHNAAMSPKLAVVASEARLIDHLGLGTPKYEILTGHLPPGPADPTELGAPRLLFTGNGNWNAVRHALQRHATTFITQGAQLLTATGDSLARALPSSRERLAAVTDQIEQRCRRIPRSLTASSYYPRNPQVCLVLGAAEPLEWALLTAALATAAKLQSEVHLARRDAEGFDPLLPTPMQFDRVVLRVLIPEEDRTITFDPWIGGPGEGLLERIDLLLPLSEADHPIYHLPAESDYLERVEF